jgi:hypothetical protein
MPNFIYKVKRTQVTYSAPMVIQADTWLDARVRLQATFNQNNAYRNAEIILIKKEKENKNGESTS